MHISKKLGFGAIAGALLGYAFVWKTVIMPPGLGGGRIPTYGSEIMEAHLNTLLILAAVVFVLLPNVKTLTTPKNRKIALVIVAVTVLFQLVILYDFSKAGVESGLGYYLQVAGIVCAGAAAWMAKK